MKKFLLFLISLIAGIYLFSWTIKLVGWDGLKSAFLVFTGWNGLAILGLTALIMLVGTWKWKEILKGGGTDIPFKSLLNPYLAGFAIIFLAPILIWGGEIFRSYILKKRHSVVWSKAVASVAIDRILEWTANLTIIFFGGLIFIFKVGIFPTSLIIIFGGLFLVFFTAVCFFYIKSIRKESIFRFFVRHNGTKPLEVEKEIFEFFKGKKIAMWRALALSFLRASIMYLRAFLLVIFLGKTISALSGLSILAFSYLAVMIPIPASLGTHEAAQALAFNSLGLGVPTATAFTMIIRAAEVIAALIGVVLLSRLGVILIKEKFFKKLSNFGKKINI